METETNFIMIYNTLQQLEQGSLGGGSGPSSGSVPVSPGLLMYVQMEKLQNKDIVIQGTITWRQVVNIGTRKTGHRDRWYIALYITVEKELASWSCLQLI